LPTRMNATRPIARQQRLFWKAAMSCVRVVGFQRRWRSPPLHHRAFRQLTCAHRPIELLAWWARKGAYDLTVFIMLEQAIERLTDEVEKLRLAIEHHDITHIREPISVPVRAVAETVPPTGNRFVEERAVAELLGVSVALLRKWRLFRNGPPYHKVGRLVRYSSKEVLEWLHSRRAE
jgi:predicted DNA-binding transcriptional regulator AlpA